MSGLEKTGIIPESATKSVKENPFELKLLISCARSEVGDGILAATTDSRAKSTLSLRPSGTGYFGPPAFKMEISVNPLPFSGH